MRDDVIDILLRLGIPAGSKGFCYIHDAMELLDEDPYYISGKIGCLYGKIAKHQTGHAGAGGTLHSPRI